MGWAARSFLLVAAPWPRRGRAVAALRPPVAAQFGSHRIPCAVQLAPQRVHHAACTTELPPPSSHPAARRAFELAP
eukprot:717162-Pyramimonas_sp.AAC.1